MRHLVLAALLTLHPLSIAAEPLAILPVKLLDTSREPGDQGAAHEARLLLLADVLKAETKGAILLDAAAIADCQPQTTACLLDKARATGADRVLFVVVQKTSTLILQIFANLVDVGTGDLIVSRNLNFRGDNDESWRRAARFLARQLGDASN